MSVATQEMAEVAPRSLRAEHQRLVDASGITTAVAQARGYRSLTKQSDAKRLGFGDAQARVPALLIPIWSVSGEIATYQLRPDAPRVVDGKAVKYETPRSTKMVLDVPRDIRGGLRDPSQPLFITEGARKADAAVSIGLCCIALLGVWNFRGTNAFGGKTALADWESIALTHRDAYIVFDSDVMQKPEVHDALTRLKAFLDSRGARTLLVYLPAGEGGAKTGLDDFLAAGKTVDDLLALATTRIRRVSDELLDATYEETRQGIIWRKPTSDGDVIPTLLTNFRARILADIREDDGVETRLTYEIEGSVNGRTVIFTVPAAQFGGMNWPAECLGANAVVSPGNSSKDRARHAIQVLSGHVPERRVYTHIGWRHVDGRWLYLHAGGALDGNGIVDDIDVALPQALAGFALPAPAAGQRLKTALEASLRILDLADDVVTFPVYFAIWRAMLGDCNFSLAITGETQAGKTELATLAQQHFGAGLAHERLPATWKDTSNALEELAHKCKDAVLAVDDFAPTGALGDVQRLHHEADRLLRGQGNQSGRLRMRRDTTLRAAKPPRGLIVLTGEDVPRGQSLRARMVILELRKSGPGAIRWEQLGRCQIDGSDGRFVDLVASFVAWLASNCEAIRAAHKQRVATLRDELMRPAVPRRSVSNIAELLSAAESFFVLWRIVACYQRLTSTGYEAAPALPWRAQLQRKLITKRPATRCCDSSNFSRERWQLSGRTW